MNCFLDRRGFSTWSSEEINIYVAVDSFKIMNGLGMNYIR